MMYSTVDCRAVFTSGMRAVGTSIEGFPVARGVGLRPPAPGRARWQMGENVPDGNCRPRGGFLPFAPGNLRRRKYISIRHERTQTLVRICPPRYYRKAILLDHPTRHRLRAAVSHGTRPQAQCDRFQEVITQIGFCSLHPGRSMQRQTPVSDHIRQNFAH